MTTQIVNSSLSSPELQSYESQSSPLHTLDSKNITSDFSSMLKENIDKINEMQITADTMAEGLATGKAENIHETMIAISKAELGFNFMVQVRNKVLNAYQEIMNMPV